MPRPLQGNPKGRTYRNTNWTTTEAMREATRLLHDMSEYTYIGQMVGRSYKIMKTRHSVCQRPGCTVELLIASHRNTYELIKGSALYNVCVGEGAPDGSDIFIGRVHTDDTKTVLSEYGKNIAASAHKTKDKPFSITEAMGLRKGGDTT